jgi:hypothetical protein
LPRTNSEAYYLAIDAPASSQASSRQCERQPFALAVWNALRTASRTARWPSCWRGAVPTSAWVAPWFDARRHGHPGSRPPLAVGGSEAVVLDELRGGGDAAVLAASAGDRPVAVPAPRPGAGGGSAVRAPVVRSLGVVRERVGAGRARRRRRGVVARLPVPRWVVLERDPGSDLGGRRSASWWSTFDA